MCVCVPWGGKGVLSRGDNRGWRCVGGYGLERDATCAWGAEREQHLCVVCAGYLHDVSCVVVVIVIHTKRAILNHPVHPSSHSLRNLNNPRHSSLFCAAHDPLHTLFSSPLPHIPSLDRRRHTITRPASPPPGSPPASSSPGPPSSADASPAPPPPSP